MSSIPFEIVSEYKPTGDQPTAIDGLVEAIENGEKNMTLLGATGTGKSLGYDDPVYVEVGDDVVVRPIGLIIDQLFSDHDDKLHAIGDTQELHTDSLDSKYFTQAIDAETGKIGRYPIRAFIRHTTPAKMFRLTTACGRSATMTGDHNLWVLREGQLHLIETSDARPTDCIPLPLDLPEPSDPISYLDTIQELADERLFVHARSELLNYIEQEGTAAFIHGLESGAAFGRSKVHAIRHDIRGAGIEANTFVNLLDKTENLSGQWNATQATIGGKQKANDLPAELALTANVLRLFGYYIAEGNAQRGYIILANHAPIIRENIEDALDELALPYGVRQTSDYQISSTALTRLLKKLCGQRSNEKQLPYFWSQLSNADLAIVLRAYFDGDGTVGRACEVSATTASKQLASDLAYALLRFGIWARIRPVWKRATNSDHEGAWYQRITISGQDNLTKFADTIGFDLPYKQEKLVAQTNKTGNSNVDVVPIDGRQLRDLRESLGLYARQVAEVAGISRSGVQMIETNRRNPSRSALKEILEGLATFAATHSVSADWRTLWQTLYNFCQAHWTPVADVSEAAYDKPYVYDLSVKSAETFLAGNGGFFVHNTFTVANVIERTQRPTLVLAHNKTLAAQLYSEFKEFFPNNAVSYFVSYYDYYQPEAYVARKDLFIEKESQINEEIDRLRILATTNLLSRRDAIIVASVSCIYGLANPKDWGQVSVKIEQGGIYRRDQVLRRLINIQYDRNDMELRRGAFRVRGDVLQVVPAYAETAFTVEFWGDEVERITEIDPLTGELLKEHHDIEIFPAKAFVTNDENLADAINDIETELSERIAYFQRENRLLEAQRIEQRTMYDLEMLREIGFCSGVENYSRHLDRRQEGEPPWTLLDYFPGDYLLVVDESHMTLPQVRGMYKGDRSRKETLVDYGFRLPSAMDNRPLRFEEFLKRANQMIYTTATPAAYEKEVSTTTVHQIIRPTGILDPEIEVRPVRGQIDDLLAEIKKRIAKDQRTLVTTLTKRMSEDLADYLLEMGIKVHYLHSEVHTLERTEILRDFRLGIYDVVVGINLLREGLDLPEVSLIAIVDADKEGFLRSETALVQTIGRAARHIEGKVIMYADKITDSMAAAIRLTNERREKQKAYNEEHGITPQNISKVIHDRLSDGLEDEEDTLAISEAEATYTVNPADLPKEELNRTIKELERQMKKAAELFEFEKAAELRDQLKEMREVQLLQNNNGKPVRAWEKYR